jgi:hypothetical protein
MRSDGKVMKPKSWKELRHMKNNRWRKGFVAALSVFAVITALGGLAWALNGAWTTKALMPTFRYAMGSGVVNGILYEAGGYNGSFLNTLEAYDPASDTWSTKASMPTTRAGLGAGVVNGIFYAVGGGVGATAYDTNEAYDPSTNMWDTTKAHMPTARQQLGVGVVNGIVYAVGGFDSTGNLDKVEAYDPGTDSWTTKASMPTARSVLGVGVVNGILYAVGGQTNTSNFVNTVEAYNPSTNTWSTKAPMSIARTGPGVAVVNGILFAAGAEQYPSCCLNSVEAYNPSTDTWTPMASMPTARTGLGTGVVNGILYAIGGFGGSQRENEAFASPFFATFFPNLKIDFDASSFNLIGTFTLGATRSIGPLNQDVTVQVGSYSVTSPAGSFHRDSKGNFVYQGTINGVALQASITPHRGSSGVLYSFAVAGQGVTNLPFRNPVTVGLTIGDNGRSANVTARFE